jgi:IPT/TIG domain
MQMSFRRPTITKPSVRRSRTLAALTFLIFVCITSLLQAAPVSLAWDRNSESDIAGYVVSYGSQSGTYTTSIDVGNVITSTVDLPAGQRSFVIVQAYNTSSQMSLRSIEIVVDLGTTPAPSITGLSPTSGLVGASVTISGANFGSTQGTSSLRFNGTVATPTSWSASSIVTTVPSGATTGSVVATVGGMPSNNSTFTVTSPAPSIASLSPTSGAVGTAVTIGGANFGATQGASSIRFNGTVATPTSWSAASIVVAVPSGATTGAVTVTVNGVASNGATFTVTTTSGLPAPWASQDVGNPAIAGQATYVSGTFSVSGAGADIWDVYDQFRFVYQTLDGDGAVVARLVNLQNADPRTKAGVMIRQDLTADAPNAMAAVTAANGMAFQSRATRGGISTSTAAFSGGAPRWIRVVRSGTSVSGYHSKNGKNWTLMGTATVTMASRVYVGLALTSHNPSLSASSTFSSVTVTSATTTSQMSAATADLTAAQPEPDTLMTAEKRVVSPALVNRLGASDYDGDGRSDLAVYRPESGTWRVVESGASSATGVATPWGTATDLPVPGDYDGDGRTDLAYYRPSTGVWSILESTRTHTTRVDLLLGGAVDVPVPGDYDGDGRTDLAVYSPITGQWWMLKSSTDYGAVTAIEWSAPQGVPVPGDYDGDGRADLGVYQPATGQWLILLSSTDYATNLTFVLGTTADVPVAADFDGDGVTDPAVFHGSTGVWRAALSTAGFKATLLAILGAATDVPVTADYDGDGKADLAVFRNGTWQILYSGASYASGVSASWGKRSDIPLPGQR